MRKRPYQSEVLGSHSMPGWRADVAGAAVPRRPSRPGLAPVRPVTVHIIVFVHRNIGAEADLEAERTGRDHRVEREHLVGDAPVVAIVFRRTVGSVGRAELGVDDAEAGVAL